MPPLTIPEEPVNGERYAMLFAGGWSVFPEYGETAKESPAVASGLSEADARLLIAADRIHAIVRELADCAAYWSEYDVPLGIVDRLNAVLSRLETSR